MSAVLAPRLELVPLGHGDLDEMLAIENQAHRLPWSRGNFVDSIAAGYSLWGGRLAGELAGYFVLMLIIDEAHLLNISVAEKRRRMGFGGDLLHHAMDVARSAGATSMLLEVRPSNVAALGLYACFGFCRIGLRRAYYPGAQGAEDALVLRHALAGVER